MLNKTLIIFAIFFIIACSSNDSNTSTKENNLLSCNESYAQVVRLTYQDCLNDALQLQKSINIFLENPSENNLKNAKNAWLNARESYGQSEVFRFYNGPIDFADELTGTEGPEGLLNAWPLDEAYIDYVKNDKNSGIINATTKFDKDYLINNNAQESEESITTGYHAIEFLLWGQDLSLQSAGQRSYKDYIGNSTSVARRKQYLKLCTELLIEHLTFLVQQWQNEPNSYYTKTFKNLSEKEFYNKILSSLAILSNFEMAAERMATSLDSQDQEDEHSCFSDNTHRDFITNQQGIINVYFAKYNKFKGKSLNCIATKTDTKLASKIASHLSKTLISLESLDAPIDNIIASNNDSKARKKMEQSILLLQEQGKLFKQLGNRLGVEVIISGE